MRRVDQLNWASSRSKIFRKSLIRALFPRHRIDGINIAFIELFVQIFFFYTFSPVTIVITRRYKQIDHFRPVYLFRVRWKSDIKNGSLNEPERFGALQQAHHQPDSAWSG